MAPQPESPQAFSPLPGPEEEPGGKGVPGRQRAPCSRAEETQPSGERRNCLDRGSHPSAVGPGVLAGWTPWQRGPRRAPAPGPPGQGRVTLTAPGAVLSSSHPEPAPTVWPQAGEVTPPSLCVLTVKRAQSLCPRSGWCAWHGAGIQEALAECCPLLCEGWAPCGLWQVARSSGPRRPLGAGVGLRLGSFSAWE